MFVRLFPINSQARSTTVVPTSTARSVASTLSEISHRPDLHSPSECFIALEKARDQTCYIQHRTRHLWTTMTFNLSPSRSTLRNLSYENLRDIRFRRLQSLVNTFTKTLNADLDMNLKFYVRGVLKLSVVATIIHREQKYLAQFLDMWDVLEPYLRDSVCYEMAWSKEFFDLLELMLQTMRRLQDQLDDVHHDLRNFLDPRRACAVNTLNFAPESSSATTGFLKLESRSGLRGRAGGLVGRSCKEPTSEDSSFLLNQAQMTR